MGLARFFRRMSQSDEERLVDEVRVWADSIPDTTRIGDCERRRRARVAGVVRRITLHPLEGKDSISAVVHDGTGELTVVWNARDRISGLRLGTRVVLEGLVADERGISRMVNPSFEFV